MDVKACGYRRNNPFENYKVKEDRQGTLKEYKENNKYEKEELKKKEIEQNNRMRKEKKKIYINDTNGLYRFLKASL